MRLYSYTTPRGICCIDLICRALRYKVWYLPDLICDDVVEKVRYYVPNGQIKFYHVNEDFSLDLSNIITKNSVIYTIDYFGMEQPAQPDHIHIRDGVWFPNVNRPISDDEVWFNSFRKIYRGSYGSLCLSSFDLGVSEPFSLPAVTIQWDVRWRNYETLKRHLEKFSIPYTPMFPSLFPIRLNNRDEVLSKLEIKTPGMWKGELTPLHPFYKQLAFLSLDSRFSTSDLTQLASQIEALAC
jgi:hypothetical protein